MDTYTRTTEAIINAQKKIIGPIAVEQASKVSGLTIAGDHSIRITGNAKSVILQLVEKYEELFGQASVEVCKDAVREIKPPVEVDQLPDILK